MKKDNLKNTKLIKFSCVLLFLVSACQRLEGGGETLDYWITAPHRETENIQRNQYRHPVETLEFFEVGRNMKVGEIWPSKGWYTEILAPWLRDNGQLYAVGFSLRANRTPKWRKTMVAELEKKFQKNPEIYDRIITTGLAIPGETEIAPAGSLDRVLTFRNVHNWMKGGYAREVFESMFNALSPGGILGVVEHRARPGTSLKDMIVSGYVTEEQVIKLAQLAGFVLLGKSEINANPLDTTVHTKGVWTLPPSFRAGNEEEYRAIGESDRMTLKFQKPR